MIYLFLLIAATVVAGFCCFRFLSRKVAIVMAALLPWCIYLIFNLTSEYSAPDKEITAGSWLAFQLIFGSFFAALGVLSGWLTNRDNRK